MAYCIKCGNKVENEAVVCVKCGCLTSRKPLENNKTTSLNKKGSYGWIPLVFGVLAFIDCLFGVLTYFIRMRDFSTMILSNLNYVIQGIFGPGMAVIAVIFSIKVLLEKRKIDIMAVIGLVLGCFSIATNVVFDFMYYLDIYSYIYR